MQMPQGKLMAMACVQGNTISSDLCGTVKFYQCCKGILVQADISGLPQTQTNIFAMHIHDGNHCTGNDFAGAGGHLNPRNLPHPLHAGDLPPLFSCGGRGYLTVLTDRITIEEICSKTLIIHDGPDDFRTQPAGNAGEKIGCGVIKRL